MCCYKRPQIVNRPMRSKSWISAGAKPGIKMMLRAGVLVLGLAGIVLPTASQAGTTNYIVRGIVKGIRLDDHQLVIAHEQIPNFMDAMTMPFPVKDTTILTNVAVGTKITFQL